MSTTHTDRLRALLEPLAVQAGLDLEDVKVTKAAAAARCRSTSTPTAAWTWTPSPSSAGWSVRLWTSRT